MRPRSPRRPFAAIACVLVALTGCGEDDPPPAATTAPDVAATAPAATPPAEPAEPAEPATTATAPTTTAPPARDRRSAPGPPRIPFRRGDGRVIGALARSAYTARAFSPIPATFRRGGIPAGSRAGPCRVTAPTRRDHRQLRRLARERHPGDMLQGIFDEQVLLADCGRLGRHGLLVWTRIQPDRDRVVDLVQLRRREGRWEVAPARAGVGCGVPRAAASAWRIDVSPCPTR